MIYNSSTINIVGLYALHLFIILNFLLQMELRLRLMELNWQKSQCVKVITADGRNRSEVRVGGLLFP